MLAAAYPVLGGRKNDVTNEDVEFEILAPVHLSGPLGTKLVRQEVQMRVSAAVRRVEDVARATLSEIADVVSFGSGRRVKLSLGSFTNAPAGVTTGDYQTILPMTRMPPVSGPVPVPPELFAHVATSVGDSESDRGRRLTRALRWLRRSFTASDEFSEFTALAFAYESLTPLLPDPLGANGKSESGRNKKSKQPKAGSSEKLRHWAVEHAKIKPEDWMRVGRLRHSLFHGGLSEDSETSGSILQAIPLLRFALTAALKHLLGLPANAPPATSVPPVTFVSAHITIPGVVLTKPPETDADIA